MEEIGERKISHIQADDLTSISVEDPFARSCLVAAVKNYQYTNQAYKEIKKSKQGFNSDLIGDLMNRHHKVLRDLLRISTPKIEKMIGAAEKAGAKGAKITGSGQGGCMVAFCPGKETMVSKAIEETGGRSYIVEVTSGAGNC